jgi:phospholipase C
MGTRPAKVDASEFDTATPIKHVVYVIKENRTFDNMFGKFPGADGVTAGMDQGEERPLTEAPDRLPEDIKHCYECALQAWNEGEMDGFATISEWADRYAYTQFRPEDLPAYWHWAQRFVLADNFFASAQGPSFPNHLYTIGAVGARREPGQDLPTLRERHRHRAVQGVGLRLAADNVPVVDRRARQEGATLLRLPHRGGPAHGGRDPVGLLLGHQHAERLSLVRLRRDPPHPEDQAWRLRMFPSTGC